MNLVAGLVAGAMVAVSAVLAGRLRTGSRERMYLQGELDGLRRARPDDGSPPRLEGSAEWRAVLAHELRSSVAAILGYTELLADGTFGPLDDRAGLAVRRIGHAADQLLGIVEALEDPATAGLTAGEFAADVTGRELIVEAVRPLLSDAEARGVTLHFEDGDTELRTRRNAAVRTVRIVLGAAIRTSPGATLRLGTTATPAPAITIHGTHLDPVGDEPDHAEAPLTGAGLRVSLARRTARAVGGRVVMERVADGTRVSVILPHVPFDDAEQRP
ncbi:MAG TPA: histidine kinase dimerization/phospho-acceptor domain-containing protein [Longimicrobiales bacterium]|nr:histidine kinase dimerization/phospho-acceptor domain-containing protein [Longimicrobiales bacterium]